MNLHWRRIALTTIFNVVAVTLAVVAVLVLPIYGTFMVVWLHIPLATILATVGPLVALFGVGAYFAFRAGSRAYKGST